MALTTQLATGNLHSANTIKDVDVTITLLYLINFRLV